MVSLSREIARYTALYRLSNSLGDSISIDWHICGYYGGARGYESNAIVAVSALAELLVERLLFCVA